MGYCSLCCRHVEAVSQAACLFGYRALQLRVSPSNLFAVPYGASQGWVVGEVGENSFTLEWMENVS